MRARSSFLVFILFFLSTEIVKAQSQIEPKQPRILILLDGSSSMLQPWAKDRIRFKTAGDIITTLIDSVYKVNNQVEFALRVYGHQNPAQENNCFDTKREVMFSKDNLTQMALRVASLQPRGVSPIAYSLKEAAEYDMLDDRYNYSLILITDGGESCGGNICEVVKTLLEKKISFKPYVIGLVDYAPLKEQYNCLGNYLLVTKDKDIPEAVGKIVTDYKPMLLAPKLDRKLIQTAVVNTPSALKVDIPKFKMQTGTEEQVTPALKKETIAFLRLRVSKYLNTNATSTPSFVTKSVPKYTPPVELPEKEVITSLSINTGQKVSTGAIKAPTVKTVPVPGYTAPIEVPEQEMITSLNVRTNQGVNTGTIKGPSIKTATVPTYTPPVEVPEKEAITSLNVKTNQNVTAASVKGPAIKTASVPAYTPPVEKPEPVAKTEGPSTLTVVTKKPAEPVKPAAPKPQAKPVVTTTTGLPPDLAKLKQPKFSVDREESKETTLEVFFTDGRGKFYQTTPQILLYDPKTNKQVNKFFRTVDASGNPDPRTLPEGTYHVTVAGKSNLLVKNVEIKPNSKNKIVIQVGKASLRFEYEDDPKEPVDEFMASVKKNFEVVPIVKQLCTQELEYEPGNYHIELNTLPIDRRTVDLDFDAIVVIKVERPGYVQFTNTNNYGKVALYYQLGDNFVRFYNMNILGNPEQQKLKLQRGMYRVVYNKHPEIPYSDDNTIEFMVKSNEVTSVELK